MTRSLPAFFAALCVSGALPLISHAQPCVPRLSDQFADGWISGRIHSLLVAPTPQGPELFAGGNRLWGPLSTSFASLARWTGSTWQPLITEPASDSSAVFALTMYDDGSGPSVYAACYHGAGSHLQAQVLRWNGTSWSQIGQIFDDAVYSLRGFDDGATRTLYAAGSFRHVGGIPAAGVARLANSLWSPLGSGIAGADASARVLEAFDDGRGSALYLGGSFETVNGMPIANLARWNGHQWKPVGQGRVSGTVQSLSTLDLGSGPALYVGGDFTSGVAGVPGTRYFARWDGSAWAALGSGPPAVVRAITTFDDGAGAQLYAATEAGICARWDGQQWNAAATGQSYWPATSEALATYPTQSGPMLVIAGSFNQDWGFGFLSHRRHADDPWQTGMTDASVSQLIIFSLISFDDGSGPALYAGGRFETAGTAYSPGLAKYSASGWSSVGLAPGINIDHLAAYRDRDNAVLCASGYPNAIGDHSFGVRTNGVWTYPDGSLLSPICAVPSGPAAGLYASRPDHNIVRWTPSGWISIGATDLNFDAMASADLGSGPVLLLLGQYGHVGGLPAPGVATWDGTAWHALGHGSTNGFLVCAAAYDDGSGPALYVAGDILQIGGVECNGFARWFNGAWSAATPPPGPISALQTYDDGTGPALYAGGIFRPDPSSQTTAGLARWNGTTWSYIGGPFRGGGGAGTFAIHDDGSGPALWMGGGFEAIGNVPSARIAKLIACRGSTCYANCDESTGPGGAPTLNVNDFICFQHQFLAGAPYTNCDGSTDAWGAPTLNVNDFLCFMRRFAEGCH